MPDGRADPQHKYVEIRIEKREPEDDQSKNAGSVIPGNLRARRLDEITWFVSQRVSPPPPSALPPADKDYTVSARRLPHVTLTLIFKENRHPFVDQKNFQLVSEQGGLITAKVMIGPADGKEEQYYHYGFEVKENDKVILKDVHCPEIIIQR